MFNFIGKTLGQYRILEQIGVGGMATVYKAYQPSVDRYVAIKVLPPQFSQDEQFIKRFQREAHAIAKLEHAHILPVFDYGESEGIAYIAMRYISAGTLKSYMTKGGLPLAEISRIITQIGSALDYAHHQNVIHRDVKPANILLDEQGNTYLTDFGLARMLESSQQLTGSGVGVGTPAYMSPEQGKGEKSDHRSDIYSLGVILYEMVTGRVPFEAETPMAIVLKHINEPLPLPRVVAPSVPESVEKVILKSLAKDPVHRYQSAGEMAEALALAVSKIMRAETQPVPVHAIISPGSQKKLFWQKPLSKLTLAGGALLAILLLTIFLSQFMKRGQAAEIKATITSGTILPTNILETVHMTPATLDSTPTTVIATIDSALTPIFFLQEPATGKQLVSCKNIKPTQICVIDFQSGETTPLAFSFDFGVMGVFSWSPDGKQIVFSAAQGEKDPQKLYLINADGANLQQLTEGDTYDHESAWSPDGQWIAFHRSCRLWIIRPDGSDAHEIFLSIPDQFCVEIPDWSPDNKEIAFIYTQDGYFEGIWVINKDGSNLHEIYNFKVKPKYGGISWSPDGRQIFGFNMPGLPDNFLVNVDGSGEMQEIQESLYWWKSSFWPRWGGDTK